MKSRSGPVRVIRTFTPEPASLAQEEARLNTALVLTENKIALKEAWLSRPENNHRDAFRHLQNLRKRREQLLTRLSQIRRPVKETIHQQAPQGKSNRR